MTPGRALPPGQFEEASFERFGLGLFANRFPDNPDVAQLSVTGDISTPIVVREQLGALPRFHQTSNFHCVTTWSVLNLRWSGYRFADFYSEIVQPQAKPADNVQVVVLKGQDGYRTCMDLSDLLQPDVLLADTLNEMPLGLAHGAPMRIVAPAHYGYKNVKHLCAVEFWRDRHNYTFPFPYPSFMDHPRARVAYEERGRVFPSLWLRYVYRVLIPWARSTSRRALDKYQRSQTAR